MKLKIVLALDNAAFEEPNGSEIARILREFAEHIDQSHISKGAFKTLRDINGNTVGDAVVK